MILHTVALLLWFPVALSYDHRWTNSNFRNRRTLTSKNGGIDLTGGGGGGGSSSISTRSRTQPKKNAPFLIRVPYSKIVPSNALFSHSVSWKAKQTPTVAATPISVAVKSSDDAATSVETLPDLEVTQFHSQDTNGGVVFGFNAPDQMRIEQRNADGTVHGTYSYLDPYGQVIKRQYWDTGAGFHVSSNSYPLNAGGGAGDAVPYTSQTQYTPEVQAARDLHFHLYQQALASLLPSVPVANSLQDEIRRSGNGNATINATATATATATAADIIDDTTSVNGGDSLITVLKNESLVMPARLALSTASDSYFHSHSHSHSHSDSVSKSSDGANYSGGSINIADPDTENGSIVIQKPEYLRISWTTENKTYRGGSAATFASAATISGPVPTNQNDTLSSRKQLSNVHDDVTKFRTRGDYK